MVYAINKKNIFFLPGVAHLATKEGPDQAWSFLVLTEQIPGVEGAFLACPRKSVSDLGEKF